MPGIPRGDQDTIQVKRRICCFESSGRKAGISGLAQLKSKAYALYGVPYSLVDRLNERLALLERKMNSTEGTGGV